MKKRILLIVFVCILSLCSFGCSSDDPENNDGSEINGANGTEKSQPIDACSLITKAEAEAAIGMAVEEPEFSEQPATGQKTCFYDGTEENIGTGFVQLSILRTDEMPDNIVEAGQSAEVIYYSLKDNDLDMKEIEGIGDEAFWGTGGLYVLKEDVYFTISVGNSSVPENVEICKSLAEIVISRL
jgi:hypothetical protein